MTLEASTPQWGHEWTRAARELSQRRGKIDRLRKLEIEVQKQIAMHETRITELEAGSS